MYFKLEDPVLDFDYYHVELFRLEDGQSNCLAIHDDMSAAHQVSLNVTATKEAWVTFPNQSYGAYCVVVIPEDERCHAIWPDGRGSQLNNRTCQRHSNTATLEGLSHKLMEKRGKSHPFVRFRWCWPVSVT